MVLNIKGKQKFKHSFFYFQHRLRFFSFLVLLIAFVPSTCYFTDKKDCHNNLERAFIVQSTHSLLGTQCLRKAHVIKASYFSADFYHIKSISTHAPDSRKTSRLFTVDAWRLWFFLFLLPFKTERKISYSNINRRTILPYSVPNCLEEVFSHFLRRFYFKQFKTQEV